MSEKITWDNPSIKVSNGAWIMPSNEEMLKKLYPVDTAVRRDLGNLYNFKLPYDWMASTITVTYLEYLIRMLVKSVEDNDLTDGVSTINFFDLLTFGVSIRTSDDSEGKDGNLTLYVNPETLAKRIVKSDTVTEGSEYEI